MSGNSISDLDLTQQPDLQQLELANNTLWALNLNNNTNLWSVDITNNYFRIAYIPLPKAGWYEYYYNPQRKIDLFNEVYHTYDVIDLRTQRNRDGVNFVFTWKNTAGKTLKVNEDYSENSGIFAFLKVQEDSVFCEITNSLFPALVLETTRFTVISDTTVDPVVTTEVTLSPNPFSDFLHIKSDKPINKVCIYNYSGAKILEYDAGSKCDVDLPLAELKTGLYLVNMDGNCNTVLKL